MHTIYEIELFQSIAQNLAECLHRAAEQDAYLKPRKIEEILGVSSILMTTPQLETDTILPEGKSSKIPNIFRQKCTHLNINYTKK